MDPILAREIEGRITEAVGGTWSISGIETAEGLVLVGVTSEAGAFALEARPSTPGRKAYRILDDLAFSYRSEHGPPVLALLDRAITALHAALAEAAYDFEAPAPPPSPATAPAPAPEASPAAPEASPAGPEPTTAGIVTAPGEATGDAHAPHPVFPTPFHRHHLESEAEVTEALQAQFHRDGHVLMRGALDRGTVLSAREVAVPALRARSPEWSPSAAQDAYTRAFTQITNVGLDDVAIGTFTQAPRIAKLAADLLGVSGVRVFCEDWLTKEAGAVITPWHQDAAVMPFDDAPAITAWIPFQPVDDRNGRLRFARGSHRLGRQGIENINDESEARFAEIIRAHDLAVEENPPMLVGDVSFHHGLCIHGAGPNGTESPRYVLALHFFADGARLVEPATPVMRSLRALYAPDLATGALAKSRFWPRTWPVDDARPARSIEWAGPEALHLHATLLPDGEAPRDVFVHQGRLTFSPVEGARSVAPPGGFLTCGLVDAHGHVSWPHDPSMDARDPAFMQANREAYAGAGVLLVRDMGSASDHVSRLGDTPGLPRIHPAGMLIVPYDGFPFTLTPPEALTRAFLERLEEGATWIKVFTDWTDDWGGGDRTGFSGGNPVTYPLEILSAAVEAAHAAGGRVAAHCFTREGTEVAVLAGVDSLEHGWGVDPALVDEMARRGTAWVPLVAIGSSMWRAATRDADAERASWIEERMTALAELLPLAAARGVPIHAGTDWFPEVTVVDEIRQLHELGLSAEAAVAAGTWSTRRWLREPGLDEGAPADLVLYPEDPRIRPEILDAPTLILSGGVPVEPDRSRLRPFHIAWSARAVHLARR
jgi:imidazolonepropionase-like amidohydrolase